jgi:hypothetical protein
MSAHISTVIVLYILILFNILIWKLIYQKSKYMHDFEIYLGFVV